MTVLRLARALFIPATFLLASQSGCGSAAKGGGAGEVGTYDLEGGVFLGGDASVAPALDAAIEEDHVAVKFITLTCAGGCADVEAVGIGGNPPYAYTWEDGSRTASRHVCPSSSTNYSVTITDTAITGELARGAETARASVTADVLACPDAGSGALCVSNPSFEGTAVPASITATPWVACGSGADVTITDQTQFSEVPELAPTDGQTYLWLSSDYGNGPNALGSVSEPLCAPMRGGSAYSFKIDLASAASGLQSVAPTGLKIFGGASSCGQGQLLWASPQAGTTWSTFCVTLTPAEDTPYLTLENSDTPNTSSVLFVDHIVPVASCP
jgi:hypothetical protein